METISADIIPAILTAPDTAMCNVLTSTRIYCFYPALLRRGENLMMVTNRHHYDLENHNGFRPFNFGLRTYRSTQDWHHQDRQCNDQCPALWRSAKELRGVGIMQWGAFSAVANNRPTAALDTFHDSPFIWKIQGICLNRSCPNWKRGGSIDDTIRLYSGRD